MLNELTKKTLEPSFWNDQKESEKIRIEISKLNSIIKPLLKIKSNLDLLNDYQELIMDETEKELIEEYEKLYLDKKSLIK
ncbi:MAG: PCRF domain-containing protein [Treponema sp.]|nr:PCRF domain-containing protein [Treponema sp.]